MNYGPIIFLVAFFCLATSWFGLVLSPQSQLGRMQPTNNITDKATYPISRAGLAREGLEVYRANGCEYCHSQQARQSGFVCDIAITDPGTNQSAAIQALVQIKAASNPAEAQSLLSGGPKKVRGGLSRAEADAEKKILENAGMQADMLIVPVGPDMARGWGARRSVAEDFLYDSPVMPGSQRIGPDLANVSARLSSPEWHYAHLYAPRSKVSDSVMPPYRFLFEKRAVEQAPSPDAVIVESKTRTQIIPKREARALVAYLLSLRTDASLFNAPVKLEIAAPPASTNAASGSATNAPGTNAPPAPK